MEIINIHQAKTHLSQLLARVERGEKIIIANRGKPVALLTPYQKYHPKERIPGRLRSQFTIPDDFTESDDLISLFEGEED